MDIFNELRFYVPEDREEIDPRFNADDLAAQSLYSAWKERNISLMVDLIDKDGSIDIVNSCGETVLHQAAWHGEIEFVKMLLGKGANIDALNMRAYTPLHHACMNHKFDIVEYLIKNNADISIVSTNGWTIWRCLVDDPSFDITKEKNTLLKRKRFVTEKNNENI